MKVIKFYYKFVVGVILFLGTFMFVFAASNVDIYRKIIENEFKKDSVNSLSFDFKSTQSITGQGFKKLVGDFSLEPEATTTIDFSKSDSYLNFSGFADKEKTYVDLSLGLSRDNKEWIKLNFETRFFPKNKSLYFLLKNFNFTLTEKDLLEFSTNTLCTKDIVSLVVKANNFLDREIEGKWLKFDVDLDAITTKEEKSLLINKVKNYLIKYPIFTLVEVKSPDKQLRKFEIIANRDNLINLERLFVEVLSDSTSTIEDQRLMAEMFGIFFNKKVGEIYIDKKDFRIKKVNLQLTPSNVLKFQYGLSFNLKFDIESNVRFSNSIVQPSKYLKFDDLFDKFIEFASKEAPLFSSIETNCQGTTLRNIEL